MHKPPNISSDIVHIGSFLSLWKNILSKDDLCLEEKELTTEDIAKELGQEVDIAKELENICHEEVLICPAENNHENLENIPLNIGIPKGGEHLETLRIRSMIYSSNQKPPSKSYSRPKYNRGNYDMEFNHRYQGNGEDDPEKPCQQDPNVLIDVTIYKASKDHIPGFQVSYIVNKERDIVLIADQPLTNLRDKIVCAADMAFVSSDISENPCTDSLKRAQDIFPSNFFYIQDTFYIDLRNPLATDISGPIQDWLKKTKRPGFHETFKVELMEKMTFNDLRVQLGYPYLYCHQGNCEHLVVFTDIRLMNGHDCRDVTVYPLLVNRPAKKRMLCMVCRMHCSRWMTKADSFSPTDPTFYCDTCFKSLHYDTDGKKLGSFEAYPYIDAAIFS